MAKRKGTRLVHASFPLLRQDKRMRWVPLLGGLSALLGATIAGTDKRSMRAYPLRFATNQSVPDRGVDLTTMFSKTA